MGKRQPIKDRIILKMFGIKIDGQAQNWKIKKMIKYKTIKEIREALKKKGYPRLKVRIGKPRQIDRRLCVTEETTFGDFDGQAQDTKNR